MASALICDEPTEDRRIREEKALYHELKEYLNICSCAAIHNEAKLDIVASGFELTRNDFVFVICATKRWRNYAADGMSKYVEEKYNEKIQGNKMKDCTWIVSEIIPGSLHCYRYYIDSPHSILHPMVMFNHHKVDIFS